MGQFYSTANPNFIEDAIYQSPLDLAEKLLSKRQDRHDKFLAEVPLIGDSAKKVQYINDPVEREIVNRNLQSVNDRVNELTNKITNDPLNYNTYQKELSALKNDVMLNITSGDLSKVQASYNNYEKVMKDNEKNPDKQEILNKLFTNWQNDKGSLGRSFDYYKGVDKPDIEKMIEKVKLEPDKYTMVNGKWVDKTTGVPMSDYAKTYQGAILSDPNYEAYVKHNEFLGRGGYDMSNTPMFATGTEFQGQKYTDKEFDALKKANPTRVKEIESAAKPALIPNPNSGWFGQGLIAEAKAYNQVEKEINPVWKEEAGLGNAMAIAKMKEAGDTYRTKLNIEAKEKLMKLKDEVNLNPQMQESYKGLDISVTSSEQQKQEYVLNYWKEKGYDWTQKGTKENFENKLYKTFNGDQRLIKQAKLEMQSKVKELTSSFDNNINKASYQFAIDFYKKEKGLGDKEAMTKATELKKLIDFRSNSDERNLYNIGNNAKGEKNVLIDGKKYESIQDYYKNNLKEFAESTKSSVSEESYAMDLGGEDMTGSFKSGKSMPTGLIINGSGVPTSDNKILYKMRGPDAKIVDVLFKKEDLGIYN